MFVSDTRSPPPRVSGTQLKVKQQEQPIFVDIPLVVVTVGSAGQAKIKEKATSTKSSRAAQPPKLRTAAI
ncbi:unnamed protein product [Plutella xylostella]|uniref:(diamondback moth) hypothetical protein n=1 Tax=Plutella xylostella TaxID=51655 RepID=A0A8S4ES32_PLUXY|nr:unnamed protein product [Plutella xylostella]